PVRPASASLTRSSASTSPGCCSTSSSAAASGLRRASDGRPGRIAPVSTMTAPEGIGERQRLGATMVLSLLVHGLVVLGVGFALDDASPVIPTLDVILTRTTSALTQAQADFLAQSSNQGGGDDDASRRPRDPQAGQLPREEAGVAQRTARAQSPDAATPPEARVVSSRRGEEALPTPEATPRPDRALPPGQEKIDRDLAMARLAAEIHLQSERYAKRPKRKFVSASTQEWAYATYLRAWVDRVERVGNLNYPDEARRRQLAGTLVISV